MAKTRTTRLAEIVREHEQEILTEWLARQGESLSTRRDLMNENERHQQSRDFLKAFIAGTEGSVDDIHAPSWRPALELLARISDSRAIQGFSPIETATFVFSLKQALFNGVIAPEETDTSSLRSILEASGATVAIAMDIAGIGPVSGSHADVTLIDAGAETWTIS